MTAKVSVIIPAFNCADFISQAVGSVTSQTHEDLEILVADDASTDGTRELVEKISDGRVRKFYNARNLGYLRTCNRLFAECTGDYITFQDADDFSDSRRIGLQLGAFSRNSKLGACGTNVIYLTSGGRETGRSSFREGGFNISEPASYVGDFCMASVMVSRNVLSETGGYREYFDRKGSEDHDWLFRIAEKHPVVNLPDALYYYRQRADSVSKRLTGPDQLISGQMAIRLAEERKLNGVDPLEAGDFGKIRQMEQLLRKPFADDASLFHRIAAERLIYLNRHADAVRSALRSIAARPGKIINYRTLLYCLRNPGKAGNEFR